jgi:hypothetical protein
MIRRTAGIGIQLLQWQFAGPSIRPSSNVWGFVCGGRHDARTERGKMVGKVRVNFDTWLVTVFCVDLGCARSDPAGAEELAVG